MTVDVIGDVDAFTRLREEWTDLLADSAADCLFLTWEWQHTWWRHLAGRQRLTILAVRLDGRLVGLAPLALARPRFTHAMALGTLSFLGTGQVGSDYLDVIIRRGHEGPVVRALSAHLDTGHTMLALRQLDADSALAWGLSDGLASRGWTTRRAVTTLSPFVDLRHLDWQTYLDRRGPAGRHGFSRKVRRLTQHGTVTFEAATTEQARHDALDRLIAFHLERWAPRGGSDGFDRPELLSFHEEFSRLALERGWLRLYTLRVGAIPVTGFYCFRYLHTMLFYQSGFDLAWAARSVGVVAMGLAIKAAIDEGADTYDMLHGEETYKFLWAHQARRLARLELYPADLVGSLRLRGVEATRRARGLVRWLRMGVRAAYVTSLP